MNWISRMNIGKRASFWLLICSGLLFSGGCSMQALGADLLSAIGTGNGLGALGSSGLTGLLGSVIGAAT